MLQVSSLASAARQLESRETTCLFVLPCQQLIRELQSIKYAMQNSLRTPPIIASTEIVCQEKCFEFTAMREIVRAYWAETTLDLRVFPKLSDTLYGGLTVLKGCLNVGDHEDIQMTFRSPWGMRLGTGKHSDDFVAHFALGYPYSTVVYEGSEQLQPDGGSSIFLKGNKHPHTCGHGQDHSAPTVVKNSLENVSFLIGLDYA